MRIWSNWGVRIGNLSFREEPNEFFKQYSEATATVIDEEVKKMVDECYHRVLTLIRDKRATIEKLVARLLEKETLDHDELVAILGTREFSTPSYEEYVRQLAASKGTGEEPEQPQPTTTAPA